jgi:hypothetical protein
MKTVVEPGSGDWAGLMQVLREMASMSQLRANNLLGDEVTRAKAQATSDAYLFAVQMIDLVYYAAPKGAKKSKTKCAN